MNVKQEATNWKLSVKKDAYDHDSNTVSQYDDAANINGGVSPYDTRLKELDEITPTYDELMA